MISPRNLLFSSLSLGFLVITKMSSPLIVIIFLLILLARFLPNRPVEIRLFTKRIVRDPLEKFGWSVGLLLAYSMEVVGILWLVYNFNYLALNAENIRLQILSSSDFLTAAGLKASIFENLDDMRILPPAYLEGLSYGLQTSELRSAFLCGNYSVHGWWWFFPFAFLIKTPLATLLLILLSIIPLARRNWFSVGAVPRKEGRNVPYLYDLAPLLILGGVYGIACLTSPLDIGHRHMMPIYPVLFVLAGANTYWLMTGKMILQIGLMVLLFGTALESICARPNYIAFFNVLVGGPKEGYHYLVDSSGDWGQDLPGLHRWLDENVPAGDSNPVYLSYFGTGDPSFYGINALTLPGFFDLEVAQVFPLRGGVYCISATMLQAIYTPYRGPWIPAYEALYGETRGVVDQWNETVRDPLARAKLVQEKGADYWAAYEKGYGYLRFSRICAYLRHRTPMAEIGDSILIYRLSDNDIEQALIRPSPE